MHQNVVLKKKENSSMLELNKENNMWKTNGFNKTTQSASTSSKQVCAHKAQNQTIKQLPASRKKRARTRKISLHLHYDLNQHNNSIFL
jgi:diadenosine tetraphosphatase ApaH/serine/threonine PP2A family protein phosphatase